MPALLTVALTGAVTFADPSPGPRPAVTAPAAPTPAYLLLESPERRVRAPQMRVQSLLEEGLRRSPTFAALLNALARTDVIVYVESSMTLPKDTQGRLTMVPLSGPQRYLRIQIRSDLTRFEGIALIAHEMRHALEIGEAADVRDPRSLIRLYERIGHSSGGEHAFDTDAAQDTGRQVRRELSGVI